MGRSPWTNPTFDDGLLALLAVAALLLALLGAMHLVTSRTPDGERAPVVAVPGERPVVR